MGNVHTNPICSKMPLDNPNIRTYDSRQLKEHIFAPSPSNHITDNCELKTDRLSCASQQSSKQHIIDRTNEGDKIAAFLVDTMQGETPGVKVNHRMDAAKQLIKYGFTDAQCDNIPPLRQEESESPAQSSLSPGERARVRGEEIAKPISHLDIINYQIAHLIRHETAEGHTIVNFLVDIMTGRDRPFTPKKFCIKPADRMAAARELLRRGFGDLGSRRNLSDITDEANAYDTLHTDLARRMREYSERGADNRPLPARSNVRSRP